MKKLALTFLCIAFSTALLATTKASSGPASTQPGSKTAITGTPQSANSLSGSGSTLTDSSCEDTQAATTLESGQNCSSSTEAVNLKNPIKKRSANRSYSLGDDVTYTTGVGLRFGGSESGATIKRFIDGSRAVEGIISSSWADRGLRITGLYETQRAIGQDGWYWYWGVGGHAGLFNDSYWSKGDCNGGKYEVNGVYYDCDTKRAALGVDAVLGVEYHFLDMPITFTVDAKPSVDLLGWGARHYGDVAFSLRYAF